MKIYLKNHPPPLSIVFKREVEVGEFRVFFSGKHIEPGIGMNEGYLKTPKKLVLNGVPVGKFGDLVF